MVEAHKIVPEPKVKTTPELPLTVLQGTSIKLSHVARDFILESWDVRLPALPSASGGGCQ